MNKCWFNLDAGSVQYCFDFMQAAGDSHSKGLVLLPVGSVDTDNLYFLPALKSGEHSRKGIVVNYCPFCGTNLVMLVKREQKAVRNG